MALQSINRSPFEGHRADGKSTEKPAPVNPKHANLAPPRQVEATQVRDSAPTTSGHAPTNAPTNAPAHVQNPSTADVSGLQPASPRVADTGSSLQTTEEFLAMIGGRVRSRRNSLGMSRKRLAAGSGVSERYLAQLEAGQGNMSIALLRKVAVAMEMPLDVLIKDPANAPDLKAVSDAPVVPQTGNAPGLTSVGRGMNATG